MPRHAGVVGRPHVFFKNKAPGQGRDWDPGGGRRGHFSENLWPAGQAGMARHGGTAPYIRFISPFIIYIYIHIYIHIYIYIYYEMCDTCENIKNTYKHLRTYDTKTKTYHTLDTKILNTSSRHHRYSFRMEGIYAALERKSGNSTLCPNIKLLFATR